MSIRVVFPGTFDPITNGHVDLIERAADLFAVVLVGIAENKNKKPLFSLTERVAMVQAVLSHIPNVKVLGFTQLLVDFATENGASAIIRGLRAVADFEYEFQLANMNRRMAPQIKTLLLTTSEQNSFISSTLVKEVAMHKGNVVEFVPPAVADKLRERFFGT